MEFFTRTDSIVNNGTVAKASIVVSPYILLVRTSPFYVQKNKQVVMGNGHARAYFHPLTTLKSKWATTTTDTAEGNVIQRIPGITMSETNNTARMIPMTEEDKRNLEEVLFNQHLRSMGLDFLKMY